MGDGRSPFELGGLALGVALIVGLPLGILAAARRNPRLAVTLWLAWKGRFDAHRRIARYTLPAWLYVSVTGVLVYVMLYWVAPMVS